MGINDKLRAIAHGSRRICKKVYKITYMNPVIAYKKLGCPAINNFDIDIDFQYKPDSYYPALLKKNEKKAKKIYSRTVDFDHKGIPMYRGFTAQRYWPVTITQYGLLNYNFYLSTKDRKYSDRVIAVCDWLLENIDKTAGAWYCNIDYHCNVVDEDMQKPFCSSMVQGQAMSVLVRGYHLTKNEAYLECASKAINIIKTPVEEGGTFREVGGYSFYEEYPTKTPSLVLNGFIFALYGLYDFSVTDYAGAEVAKDLFGKGYTTLIKLLPLYDGGFCSRYSLSHITWKPNYNTNPLYHPIHINQLIAINSIKKSSILEYFINEWR